MANGSRSRRYWPPGLEDQVFIKRPHAVEQFRERAHLPPSYNFDKAEADLRSAICEAMREGETIRNTKNHGNPEKEFVVRVALPGHEVVYALVEEGATDGKYPFMCHTVFDQEMFQKWNHKGKVATLGDLPEAAGLQELKEKMREEARKPSPLPPAPPEPEEEKLLLRWKGDGGKEESKWIKPTTVHAEIVMLLHQGHRLSDIEVFKKVDFKLEIKLE